MHTLVNKTSGVLLPAMIAVPAWIIGETVPVIGSPVVGILLGMLLAFWRRPAALEDGISFTSKKLLQYSIILLGLNMDLFNVFRIGRQTLILIIFTLTATFVVAYLVGKLLNLDVNTVALIGVGTAICGGSAIVATAPVIHADDEEVARSISTIFLFNVISAFSFPFLGHLMHMSDYSFGLWSGTAVNDTSAVVAAGYTYSNTAGDLAVIVKLTRTLMIVPITLLLAYYTSHNNKKETVSNYKLTHIFPWFILGFVATSVMNTFLPLPMDVKELLIQSGKYMIVMAMVAIGLNSNIVKLVRNGWKPILLGFSCWAVLSVTSLMVQFVILKL
jgi:uncharacterized integral membrane protein (TIGR00698 family)